MRRQCSSFKIIRGGTIPIKSRELFFLHNQYIEGNLFLAGRDDDDDGSTRSQQLEGNLFLAGRDEGAGNTRYQQLEGNLLLARRDDDNDGSTRCQYTRGFPSRRFKVNRPQLTLFAFYRYFLFGIYFFSLRATAQYVRDQDTQDQRSRTEDTQDPKSRADRGVQGFSPIHQ